MKNILACLILGFSSSAMATNYFECHNEQYSVWGSFENERAEYQMMKSGNIFANGDLRVLTIGGSLGGMFLYLESPRNQLKIHLPDARVGTLGPQLGFGEVNVGNDSGRFYASRVDCTVTFY